MEFLILYFPRGEAEVFIFESLQKKIEDLVPVLQI